MLEDIPAEPYVVELAGSAAGHVNVTNFYLGFGAMIVSISSGILSSTGDLDRP